MGRVTWHVSDRDGALCVARRLPARFDFAAKTVIKGGATLSRASVAHQVRQDMWRALQRLRGFSPVVEVARRGADLEITAGGTVAGRFPKATCETQVQRLLEAPQLRTRWVQHARRKGTV